MPTIKIWKEVELEVEIDYQPDDPLVGYIGGTEVETVKLADPEQVMKEVSKMDSDEILEALEEIAYYKKRGWAV